MYNGYLLKIGTTQVPNSYIDRTSWKCTPLARRVIDSFFDLSGEYHEYLADHQRTTIQFSFREHKESEHSIITAFLSKRDNVEVEYYNDLTQTYESGIFRISDFDFQQKKTFDNTVWYDRTTIKMTEY